MATGNPIKNKHTKGCVNSTDFEIIYPGKKSSEEILNATFKKNILKLKVGSEQNKNFYYFGNNFDVLLDLYNNPNFKGKVKLIYIDPPFATNSSFISRDLKDAYCDNLVGAVFIEFIRERLIILKELLTEDGIIFVHLDENMAFPIKIIMDEIFGAQNYINWITRIKSNRKNSVKKRLGNVCDYIMVYSKNKKYTWNPPLDKWNNEDIIKQYPCIDEETGKRYKKVPIHAPGIRNGETGKEWKGMLPPKGKHWQYTPSKLDELDKNGHIYWSSNGNPRRKVFFEDNKDGILAQDIWSEFKDANNQNTKITGYPTEKNINLLERIIKIATKENDIVLDCFSGSGTTLIAAEKNNRRWIGIDNSYLAAQTTLNRIKNDSNPMGDFVGKIQLKPNKEYLKNISFDLFVSESIDDNDSDSLLKVWLED